MQSTLTSLGAAPFVGAAWVGTTADVTAGIAEVRQQLRLARSAAYAMAGVRTDYPLSVIDPTTGDCMRASASQHSPSNATDWEVVHRQPLNETRDRWIFDGTRFKNEGNGQWLHCSNTIRTPANHLYVYTTPNTDTFGAKDFNLFPTQLNAWCVTGTFTLANRRNGMFLKFGTDDATPGTGAQRVYQTGLSTATKLIFY